MKRPRCMEKPLDWSGVKVKHMDKLGLGRRMQRVTVEIVDECGNVTVRWSPVSFVPETWSTRLVIESIS